MEKWNNRKTEDLTRAFLALETANEAKLFLRDLLTEKELLELGNRWKAVRMLDEKISYARITEETGLSSTTVARISKWLKVGTGGYRTMLDKLFNNHHRTLSHPRKR